MPGLPGAQFHAPLRSSTRVVESVCRSTQAVTAPADGLEPEQASDAQSQMNNAQWPDC